MQYAILLRVNLSDANLGQADLSHARLNRANLCGATFCDARLAAADLIGTSLMRANFTGADLQEAVFKRAYMSEAIMQNADLTGANLNGADLTGVDWQGAQVTETQLWTSLGLTAAVRLDLQERGASVLSSSQGLSSLRDATWLDPALLLEDQRRGEEVRGDLLDRLLDVEEALGIWHDAIALLQMGLDSLRDHIPPQQGDSYEQIQDVANLFVCDHRRFKMMIGQSKLELSEFFETRTQEELHRWMAEEFVDELDNLHQQILKIRDYIRTSHCLWSLLYGLVCMGGAEWDGGE
jgi:Pentapeptide repeats (8 copies)